MYITLLILSGEVYSALWVRYGAIEITTIIIIGSIFSLRHQADRRRKGADGQTD